MNGSASDETLMLLYREGEGSAFDTLYARHKGPLYRYLLRQMPMEKVEALFEGIWKDLIDTRAEYRPRLGFSRMFYRLAYERLHDAKRQAGHMLDLDDACFEPKGGLEQDNLPEKARRRAALLAQIGALSDEQRELLLLRMEAGLEPEAIAAVTRLDRETVDSRLRESLRRLYTNLSDRPTDQDRKSVGSQEDAEPVVALRYTEAARELPDPAVDVRILRAAHAAVAVPVPRGVPGTGDRSRAPRITLILAALAAGMIFAIFALSWPSQRPAAEAQLEAPSPSGTGTHGSSAPP